MSENSSIDPEAARRATEAIPSIPRDATGPVFREPWEAHAFAMALALYDRGLFTWTEWAGKLGEEIKKAQAKPIIAIGLRLSSVSSRKKASPQPKRLRSITMPGIARRAEQLMASPLN